MSMCRLCVVFCPHLEYRLGGVRGGEKVISHAALQIPCVNIGDKSKLRRCAACYTT